MSTRHVGVGGGRWLRRAGGLARVAALTGVMLGVGVVPSQATSISLEFTPTQTFNDFEFAYNPPGPPPPYGYTVRIAFEEVLSNFFLTVTDTAVSAPAVALPSTPYWDGWKCVDMAPSSPQCVEFDVTPAAPENYTGSINILVQFGMYGWPAYGDPIVLGDIDSFSSLFMVFGNNDNPDPLDPLYPLEFRLGYLSSTATSPDDWNDITVADCAGDDFDVCIASVPEPATIGGLVWGILGLTVISRRLRRRD